MTSIKNMAVEVLPEPQIPPLEWLPPDEDDLPYDDGIPMETLRHNTQMQLLVETLQLHLTGQNAFVGGNMFLYFSVKQGGPARAVGPDVFVVLNVPNVRERERKSWLVWKEGKGPDVVIELLSPTTAAYDRVGKKLLYQNEIRVPEYFYYDPFSGERAGFRLLNGLYTPIVPDAQEWLVSEQLGLVLGDWQGWYKEIEARWLRWYTLDGTLLPTDAEQERTCAEQERQRAEAAEQAAEQERTRAEQEHQRAEAAEQATEQERQRATELEALLARYRAQFGDLNEAK